MAEKLKSMTLLQQWAVAAILAILPLLAAVSYAALSLQQQATEQRVLVQDMNSLSTHMATLSENLRELVRAARHYLLLKDPGFFDQYQKKSTELTDSAELLKAELAVAASPSSALSTSLQAHLAAIRQATEQVSEMLVSDQAQGEQLAAQFQVLVAAADGLIEDGNNYRQEALARGEADFSRIVEQLFLLAVLALPGTVLMMMVGFYRVSRPVLSLRQAIQRLGSHQWHSPVHIDGPADLVALGESLEWMRRQMLASENQKAAFIQHVTHELKTPLAAIIEAARLLDDGIVDLDEDQREVLAILQSNAGNLEELIQQLLNYNAVSHGLVVETDVVSVRPLCESIRRHIETAHPYQQARWRLEGESDTVPSDARLLEMILSNLLSNAYRFSPDDGLIEVRWGVCQQHWWLQVSDQGPGISDDEVDKIFTPFYRGQASRQDTASRNGVGLAIVADAVKLLGGSITVQTQLGLGACFCLEFPNLKTDVGQLRSAL